MQIFTLPEVGNLFTGNKYFFPGFGVAPPSGHAQMQAKTAKSPDFNAIAAG